MLMCRACWRRTLGALSNATSLEAQPRFSLRNSTALPRIRRTVATVALDQDAADLEPPSLSSTAADPAKERSDAKALDWVVRKHLEHLKDPYKIAEHVLKTLEKGRFEEAALLTRKASRDGKVTVSWNHLIDYQMRNQRLNSAVKLYNEMKKRSQLPDARTYTIIFRGCANSIHSKLAVAEAVRIYHTMLTNERLKPNTIHLNAVLEACARAGDIDTMFSILHTVTNGLRSPDNRTYTIVLNALRPKPDLARRSDLTDEETAELNKISIQKAKAIWEAVIADWRKAKIFIDEELVCTMGRILITGDYNDNQSVLPLLEQTMRLPRLDLAEAELPAAGKPKGRDAPSPAAADPAEFPTTTPSGFAIPGNNTLSLILTSLAATRKTTLGPKYWTLLMKRYGVQPDAENYHRLLKLLRVGKASTKTAEIIGQMPPKFMAAKTFRISLSTCVGDNLNRNAFRNATRIFDVMVANLRYPDAHAMRLYIQAARGNYGRFQVPAPAAAGSNAATDPSDPDGRLGLGRQIVVALDRMWQPFRIVAGSFSYPERSSRSPREEWARSAAERAEAIAVARRMVAAMDTIVTEDMAAPEVVKVMKTRRNILNRHVTRFYEKEQKMEGGRERNVKEGRERDMESGAGSLRGERA